MYLLGRSVCSQARLLIASLASQTTDEKRLFRIRRSGHLKDQVVMLEYLRAAKEDQNSAVFLIAVDDVLRRIAADIKETRGPK